MGLRAEGDFSVYEGELIKRIHALRRQGNSPTAQLLCRYDQMDNGDSLKTPDDLRALFAATIIEPFQDMGVECVIELKNIRRRVRLVSQTIYNITQAAGNHRSP